MTKDIQRLTQNERYDLKRKQLKEESETYNRKILDYCETFNIDFQKCIQEYYHDTVINSDEYKKLEAENQRLKKQLDREIRINRKMKEALELYAEPDCLYYIATRKEDFYELATKVLKEIEGLE